MLPPSGGVEPGGFKFGFSGGPVDDDATFLVEKVYALSVVDAAPAEVAR